MIVEQFINYTNISKRNVYNLGKMNGLIKPNIQPLMKILIKIEANLPL